MGFSEQNGYALVISAVSFLLLIFLVATGVIQAYRLRLATLIWNASNPPVARMESIQRIDASEITVFYFFRIHFVIRGRFIAGNGSVFRYRAERSISGGDGADLNMYFPVSGTLDVRGGLVVRDVFGLIRISAGGEEKRYVPVLPPVFPDRPTGNLALMTSFESSRKQQSSDEEKYYMREYMPGDRMKDINWKASFRISELITRISPMSPEQSKLITIEFRNYSYLKYDSLESIIHLNFLKSWLISFLYAMKNAYPEYRFRVITSEGHTLLEDKNDIDRFTRTLAGLFYCDPARSFGDDDNASVERYVFSTPYDRNLSGYLDSYTGMRFHIFRTSFRSAGGKTRRIRFFENPGPELLPGIWIFRFPGRRDERPATTGHGRVMIEEAIRTTLF